ncbi:tail completion protein gp17 [Methylorubrum zatmanii]
MSAINVTTKTLLANAAVKAIVGQKIHPGIAPQSSSPPDIVVDRVSGGPTYGLARSTGMTASRIQVECRARTFTAAENLGAAVVRALKDFRGTVGDLRVAIQASGSDYSDHADDASIFRRIIDFYVWTTEPAAI